LTLVRDLTGEIPDKVKLYAKTVDLYLDKDERLEYEDYIKGIKGQIKEILLDFMSKN